MFTEGSSFSERYMRDRKGDQKGVNVSRLKIYEGPKGRPEGGEWEPIKISCNRKDRLSPEVHAQL